MMLFYQHFLVIGFCILHFFPGSILLVKIWSIGTGWGWFLFFWGGLLVWMYMYVCGYVCTQWTADWITVISIVSLPPIEIKQIFTFVTFFSLTNAAHNWWKVSVSDFRAEEIPSVRRLVLICWINFNIFIHFTGLKMSWNILALDCSRVTSQAPLVWLP